MYTHFHCFERNSKKVHFFLYIGIFEQIIWTKRCLIRQIRGNPFSSNLTISAPILSYDSLMFSTWCVIYTMKKANQFLVIMCIYIIFFSKTFHFLMHNFLVHTVHIYIKFKYLENWFLLTLFFMRMVYIISSFEYMYTVCLHMTSFLVSSIWTFDSDCKWNIWWDRLGKMKPQLVQFQAAIIQFH